MKVKINVAGCVGWGAFMLALWLVGGCRVRPPGTPGTLVGRVVSCSTDAVRTQWPRVIGPVNDCLTGPEGADWQGCLNLVAQVAGVAIDVVACTVKHQAGSYAEAAAANPKDARSGRAAVRSQEYMSAVTYADDGT